MRTVTQGARSALLCMVLAISMHAEAAAIKVLHAFRYGGSAPSHYTSGAGPYAELLQASDGNFYGTTTRGGTGLCPDPFGSGQILGCGTVFRMTPAGLLTTLYSFAYDTATSSAPDGAFPTAGLIQGKDGNIYGVARDGGIRGCNGALGCGTAFRITLAGVFTRLHQFDPAAGEGGQPENHLVQAANGLLYGVAAQGGYENEGTLYSMTVNGAVHTLHSFHYEIGNDGYNPYGALLVGKDGTTLYGTTQLGGVNGNSSGGGIIFSYAKGILTTLHSFDNIESSSPGTYYEPQGALIYGPDGNLWGTTATGGAGGALFSISPDGSNFLVHYVFAGGSPYNGEVQDSGPLLGSDGLIYGISQQTNLGSEPGSTYRYNPATGKLQTLAPLNGANGGYPGGALIEGKDKYLYGTSSVYGGATSKGPNIGTVFRIAPPLVH